MISFVLQLATDVNEKYAAVKNQFDQVIAKLRDLRNRGLLDATQFAACIIAFSTEFGNAPTADRQIEICERWMPQ